MRNNDRKSRSRGEKLNAALEYSTIKGSQPPNEEVAESPLRNRRSQWKANTLSMQTDTSPSHSKSSKNTRKEQESQSGLRQDDTITTTATESSMTPRSISSATTTTGLLRSSSTNSAQKVSTPNTVGLPRSASTGSAQKGSTPFPTSAASHPASHFRSSTANSTSKDSDPKNNSNTNNLSRLRNSESPDEFEPVSVNTNNGGRRQHPITGNRKRPAEADFTDEFEPQPDIDRNTGRRKNEMHGHGKRRKQVLDSSSDEENDCETPFDNAKKSRPDKSSSSNGKRRSSASKVSAIGNTCLLCYSLTLHLCSHAFGYKYLSPLFPLRHY